MRCFWNFKGGLSQIEEWKPGCLVQITCPDDKDVEYLEQELGMPDYFMTDVADTDERARYDYDEGWLMIIVRIPHMKNVTSRAPYTTIPLGIVIKNDIIITICHQDTKMMQDFVVHHKRKGVGFVAAADQNKSL